MSKSWREQFKPIEDLGWSIRDGQELLGNAIITSLDQNTILVGNAECGTGKSLASIIPIIHKMKDSPDNNYRAVISTETITLQDQLNDKDLPFLRKTYGGFTYKKLMGRSNYLCLNRAMEKCIGNAALYKKVSKLEVAAMRMQTGERREVESIVGSLTKDEWSDMAGETDYCGSNDCEEDSCFSTKARKEALKADIVVVNHKILALDFEMKGQTHLMSPSDGMFGQVNTIVVDEAHRLEDVLSDHWTIKYNNWEFAENTGRILKGLAAASSYDKSEDFYVEFDSASRYLDSFLETTRDFFMEIEDSRNGVWDNADNPFCTQYVTKPSNKLRELMNEFETKGPALFSALSVFTNNVFKYLTKALMTAMDMGRKATKKDKKQMRQALTSCSWLMEACEILDKAMNSNNGIIEAKGMTFGVVLNGWTKRDSTPGMTIRAVPLDVGGRASRIWESVDSTVLLSATLEDLTAKNFKYFKRSLGIRHAREVRVESPFTMDRQQLVYITNKEYPQEDTTVFSVEEIVESVNATNGRSLILFTSRKDIQMAEQQLNMYKMSGRFPYTMLIQTPDVDKAKLVEQFKTDDSSVLLGLKSMFTGIDIPGERLSNVIICRFPLSRYSSECKMRISYWRTQGFPNWYERDSLTVFQQAAGRLIRSTECIGVVSILDQRVPNIGTNVFKTANIGITALGSRVTQDLSEVTKHLEGSLLEVH